MSARPTSVDRAEVAASGGGWRFEAVDESGRRRVGRLAAQTRDDALAQLDAQGLLATDLTPSMDARSDARKPPSADHWRPRTRALSRPGARSLLGELARLLHHGAPLARALEIAAENAADPSARTTAAAWLTAVSRGDALAKAVAATRAQGGAVPLHAAGVVAAGEASGRLADALGRLADDLERADRLRRAIIGALAYPIVLVIAATLVAIVLLLLVAPQFERAFASVGGEVAAEGQSLIAASRALRASGPALLVVGAIAAAASVLLAVSATARAAARPIWRAVLRILPVAGPIAARWDAARWAAAAGALLAGGATLSAALSIADNAIGDPLRRDDARGVLDAVERGDTVSAALGRLRGWPRALAHYARIGEETGRLGESLAAAAHVLEAEAESRATAAAAAAGPILVVVVGALIGLFVSTMFGAVLAMNDLAL